MAETTESGLRRRKPPNLLTDSSRSSGEKDEEPQVIELTSTPKRKTSSISDRVRISDQLNIILDEQDVSQDNGDKAEDAKNVEKETRDKENLQKLGIWEFIWLELTRGYSLETHQDRYTEKRRKVYAFCRIPYELEKFLFFGFLQCLDSFAHTFTFLPIRILFGIVGKTFRIREWTAAETCDFLKISIIIFASAVMQFVDTSMLYHIVRGQSVIKLYILSSMLEVADKLFSSFGQDILEALFWTASERGGKRKFVSTLVHWCAAVIYSVLHALLVLLQATTLNVAFNSHNQSLLTIMMSNNFVELKGSVFKKFAQPNLFQMSCSDCRERFHIVILLIVVVLRNMTAVNWKFEHLNEMIPDLIMVMFAELLVDWLKHAFITKFNEINAEVYQDFTITLAFDVVRSHEKDTFTDFSDQVSRRMGFIPIPIAIMLIRVISQSIDFTSHVYIFVFLVIWLSLLVIKVVNGVFLHAKGVNHVNQFRSLQRQAESELFRKRVLTAKSKSAPNSPRMSLIDFSDICTQATRPPPKGYTVSDVIAQLDQFSLTSPITADSPKPHTPDDQPRRSVSMADLVFQQKRRDNSLPPLQENEGNPEDMREKEEKESKEVQSSPKRRLNVCEELHDVQAYQLLDGSDNVSEIRS